MFELSRVSVVLLAVMAFGSFSSPGHAAVTTKNSAAYVGAGRWDWTIYVDTDPQTLKQIKCVEYSLHKTFANPVRRVCDAQQTKFALSTNGWGTFSVPVKIEYKNGKVEKLQHQLVFAQKRPAEPLHLVTKNWSREIEPGWWEWGVYLVGTDVELAQIRCVEYTLHPTFPNPVRAVCQRGSKGYELVARGWGTFKVGVKVMLSDGSVLPLSHELTFR